MNDRHAFGFQLINDEVAGNLALLVIAAAHAEHIAHTAFGDQRVRRAGGNGKVPRIAIHLRGGHGR